jgi:hypothetical protein
MHGRGAGLLQVRSLASHLPLRSSSARLSRSHQARRSYANRRRIGALAPADANPPTSRSRRHGRQGRGRGRGRNRRGAPPPTDSQGKGAASKHPYSLG